MFVQIGQNGCREHIDPSQQVVRRDHLVEAKLVKELSLISVLPPHHSRISCRFLSRNHCSLGSSTPFSTASTHLRHRPCVAVEPPMTVCRLCSGTEDPVFYEFKFYVELGGLASYGPDISAYFRRGADSIDNILKGEKPGDIPVELPTAAPSALASPFPEIR